jgi:hypothetical protein
MNNHWLNEAKYKRLFAEIDDKAMEAWSEDGTMADFINGLNDEQMAAFLAMKISDCAADSDTYEFGLTLMKP